jgi:hypothetical protein
LKDVQELFFHVKHLCRKNKNVPRGTFLETDGEIQKNKVQKHFKNPRFWNRTVVKWEQFSIGDKK